MNAMLNFLLVIYTLAVGVSLMHLSTSTYPRTKVITPADDCVALVVSTVLMVVCIALKWGGG